MSRPPPIVRQVISGGQTGADRGGLEAAIEAGIPHGGWCPKGRLAEDGVIPSRYRLLETKSVHYGERTERNVQESRGTVLFTRGRPTGGSARTMRLAKSIRKPILHLDLSRNSEDSSSGLLADWITENRVKVLNVAGSRESKAPGIGEAVRRIVVGCLRRSAPVSGVPKEK